MGCFTRLALCLFLAWAQLAAAARRRNNHHHNNRSHHNHRIFAPAPRRFSRSFLEQYARKCVEEFNKQHNDGGEYKYTLLEVIGGRAVEETKTLEIVAKFGRARCQKTEDRYFCQSTPGVFLEEKLFKVDIRKKTQDAGVEFKFEEKPVSTLPVIQKLYRGSVVPDAPEGKSEAAEEKPVEEAKKPLDVADS